MWGNVLGYVGECTGICGGMYWDMWGNVLGYVGECTGICGGMYWDMWGNVLGYVGECTGICGGMYWDMWGNVLGNLGNICGEYGDTRGNILEYTAEYKHVYGICGDMRGIYMLGYAGGMISFLPPQYPV